MWTIIFFTSWQCNSFVMGSHDWLSHLSDESQPKGEKRPPKSSKNEKLIFILCSTSDDWWSDPSNKSHLKCKKRPPKSSKNIKYSFWIMFNFWWLAKRSEWWKLIKMQTNVMFSSEGLLLFQLGPSVVSVRVFCCFRLGLLYAAPPPPPHPQIAR